MSTKKINLRWQILGPYDRLENTYPLCGIENIADQLFEEFNHTWKKMDSVRIKISTLMLFLNTEDFYFAIEGEIWKTVCAEATRLGMNPLQYVVQNQGDDKFNCMQDKLVYTYLNLLSKNGGEI